MGNQVQAGEGALVFALNGKFVAIPAADVDPTMVLQTYLRDVAGLTGTKYGCGEGGCGACAVVLSRWDSENKKEIVRSVNSCLRPLASCHGWAITTIEGLRMAKTDSKDEANIKEKEDSGNFHPIQSRIAQFNGLQCGYCTPGMVMTMYQALKKNPKATMEEMESQFDGNICRCTGYRPILDAAKSFASDSKVQDHVCKKVYGAGVYDQKKYDIVFPENLKTGKLPNEKLEFCKNGVKWIKPENSIKKVLEVLRANPNAILTVGRTSAGIYKPQPKAHPSESKGRESVHEHEFADEEQKETTYVDIADVDALTQITEAKVMGKDGLEIGAACKIVEVMEALTKIKDKSTSFLPLVQHMKKVANVHVRSAGSVAGNIMLAKTKGFLSDLATIFLGAGAMITWVGGEARKAGARRGSIKGDDVAKVGVSTQTTQSLEEFLATTIVPKGSILLSIHLPFLNEKTKFVTYRTAIRPLNSHSIVNAAMRATIVAENDEKKIPSLTNVVIAYAGLMNHEKKGAHAYRLTEVENILEGTSINNTTFEKARKCFVDIVKKTVEEAKGMRAEARIALAEAFFIRFLLSLGPEQLSSELSSGTESVDSQRYNVVKAKQEFEYPDIHTPVSLPIPKLTGKLLAAGSAKFIGDIVPKAGTLHAAVAVARRVRGKIKSVDFHVAMTVPGVKGFLNKDDVGDASWSGLGEPLPPFADIPLYHGCPVVLGVGDEVPYYGSPVGLVLAESEAIARVAALKVVTEYEVKEDDPKPVLTIKESKEAKGILPAFALPTQFVKTSGDAATVMKQSEADGLLKVSDTLNIGTQKHFYMEPQSAYAVPDEEQGITLHLGIQWPQGAQMPISNCLKMPQNMVNIVIKRMGGAFGGKTITSILFGALAALATKKYKRAVRLCLDRNNDMTIVGGRPLFEGDYTVAFTKEGVVKALKFDNLLASGSAMSFGWFTNMSICNALTQCYKITNLVASSGVCLTNHPPCNVQRGPGEIQASYYIESIMERIAHETGVSPHEVRKGNLAKDSKDDIVAMGWSELDAYSAFKMWNELEKKCDYKARAEAVAKFNSENKLKKRGISMIPIRYGVNIWKKSAIVNLYPDGTIVVHHGATDMGQGLNVKVAQVVSYQLGQLLGHPVPLDDIKFAALQSHVVPSQTFSGGSTASEGSCEAARRAAEVLVARLQPVLQAMEAKVKESKVKAKAEKGSEEGGGGDEAPAEGAAASQGFTFAQICAAADQANVHMQATGHWSDTKGDDKATYNIWGVGCSEIELDCLTGETVVLRVDLAYDCAKSLNPAIDIGQAEGGFVMGMGMCLQEETLFDSATGELISNGTWEYKPPLAVNIPREFNVYFHKGNNTGRVLSSKASGEPPLVLSTSVLFALRAAIFSARVEAGNKDYFKIPIPCTVTERLKLLDSIRNSEVLSKPFKE